jgi:hypothetical protein
MCLHAISQELTGMLQIKHIELKILLSHVIETVIRITGSS